MILPAPVIWQQTSPAVGPSVAMIPPESVTVVIWQQPPRYSRIWILVGSPSALNDFESLFISSIFEMIPHISIEYEMFFEIGQNSQVRILFLCTGNTCRSQMAEAMGRRKWGSGADVWSAGSRPSEAVNPNAIAVMREMGIDISDSKPKSPEDVPRPVDLVVTLCSNAADDCPHFPGARKVIHWNLPDPADAEGTENEILDVFRASRDEIRERIEGLELEPETKIRP